MTSPLSHPRGGTTATGQPVNIATVTADQASRRIAKLRAITVQHGATENEALTAARCADVLSARFGLDRPAGVAVGLIPTGCAPVSAAARRGHSYERAATADRRSPRSLRFVAFA